MTGRKSTDKGRKGISERRRLSVLGDSSLGKDAYLTLKNAIVNLDLRPGERLSQSQLEIKYRLGKASIRSALTRLEQEQLVQAVPRQGYIIAPITIHDIENVFDLRLLLEPYTAKLAAERMASDQLEKLKSLCQVQYKIGDQESVLAFLLANREFHQIIAISSGNSVLASICERLHDLSLRMLYLGIMLENQSDSWQHGHEEILTALAARDADQAGEVLHREILNSKELVLRAVLRSPVLAEVNLAKIIT
jgi:DNA-binding GntR family transcriptional regulator